VSCRRQQPSCCRASVPGEWGAPGSRLGCGGRPAWGAAQCRLIPYSPTCSGKKVFGWSPGRLEGGVNARRPLRCSCHGAGWGLAPRQSPPRRPPARQSHLLSLPGIRPRPPPCASPISTRLPCYQGAQPGPARPAGTGAPRSDQTRWDEIMTAERPQHELGYSHVGRPKYGRGRRLTW
jgi:hypothetical protein